MQDLKSENSISSPSLPCSLNLGQPSSPEVSAVSTLVSVLPDLFLTQWFSNCAPRRGFGGFSIR